MAAVGAENRVLQIKRIRHAHGGGLLTGVEVRGAGVDVVHAVILFGGANAVQHGFKLADHLHIVEDVEELLVGKRAAFVLHAFLIGIERNGRNVQFSLGADYVRIVKLALWHMRTS